MSMNSSVDAETENVITGSLIVIGMNLDEAISIEVTKALLGESQNIANATYLISKKKISLTYKHLDRIPKSHPEVLELGNSIKKIIEISDAIIDNWLEWGQHIHNFPDARNNKYLQENVDFRDKHRQLAKDGEAAWLKTEIKLRLLFGQLWKYKLSDFINIDFSTL